MGIFRRKQPEGEEAQVSFEEAVRNTDEVSRKLLGDKDHERWKELFVKRRGSQLKSGSPEASEFVALDNRRHELLLKYRQTGEIPKPEGI